MMRATLLTLSFLASFAASAQEVLVAAASDLVPLERPLSEAFAAKTGIKANFSFGSSGMLAGQIRNGAPFDVYLSANEVFTTELAKIGFVLPETVRLYALGRVGLFGAKTVAELKRPEIRHIAIPNPKHAPYGVAAEEILSRAGVLELVRPKLVYGENVRQTFEYARSGNAEVCLTSWTLVKDAGGVLIHSSQHAPIRQSGGIVKGCTHPESARKFLEFLLSPAGRLVRAGLNVP